MAPRPDRFVLFNFIVSIEGEAFGGFHEVFDLPVAPPMAEYRDGGERLTVARKVSGLHKQADVTCKRGIVDSRTFENWMQDLRANVGTARRTVTITLLDEARAPVLAWVLQGALPSRIVGPAVAANASRDVPMEELVLAAESVVIRG